ncbi:MAG: putative metalloprotease CJM1_0395 family protein [Alphaproteobacteria bacterium]|nr:putative metalloprotease CJM1_0395 family protein [Alphaproteobacteria bacterium]MDP7604893.1 putative metalloprotease CJM1_0395 family protein [Alphaproteobacteria bacterium]HJP21592.1 putative metalloprotease CJM1_0395 family protein [Alphaproteobacteria bacterium]
MDVSPIAGNPDATIRKMEVVKRAAMAPAEPSGQDRAVASRAQAEESKARAEAAAQRREEAVEARTETAGQSEPGDVGSAAAAYGGEPDAEAPTLLAVA